MRYRAFLFGHRDQRVTVVRGRPMDGGPGVARDRRRPLPRSPPPRLPISWMAGFGAIDCKPFAPVRQGAEQGFFTH